MNSLASILGGGQLLGMLGIGAGTDAGVDGGLDIAGILGSVAVGGVGVLMAIVGAIKGAMGKS